VALPRLRRALRGSLALLAVVALLTGAEGCARKKIYGESTPTITAMVGEQIIIELASNPTTGYTWMPGGYPDPLVVTLMTSDFEPNPSTTFGTGGHHRWTFRAVGPGSTTLKFNYGRTWERTPPEKSATFTINVR
jgi:inhibitor of cysteine peptidase